MVQPSLILFALCCVFSVPASADSGSDDLTRQVTSAIATAFTGDAHWLVSVREEKRTPLARASIVIGGRASTVPFEGDVEVLVRESERFIYSHRAMPGFAVLEHRGKEARTVTYADDPVEFEELVDHLDKILSADSLAAAARDADWQPHSRSADALNEEVVAVAELPVSLLESPRAAPGRGLAALELAGLGGNLVAIRAVVALDGAGALTRLTLSLDRTGLLSGMGLRGRVDVPGADEVAATRTYTIRPTTETVGKRGARVRLELLGAIAEAARAERGDPDRPRAAAPRPTPQPTPQARSPRERAAESFRATIATVDADGDGQISRVEAGDRWERLGKYDTDGDGHVTEAELLAAYDRKQARAKEPSGEPPKE